MMLLSGLCLVDSEAKKACSTQAETNQRHLYAHCHCYTYMYMYSASHAYHSALGIPAIDYRSYGNRIGNTSRELIRPRTNVKSVRVNAT